MQSTRLFRSRLLLFLLLLHSLLFPLAVAVPKQVKMGPHYDCVLDKLLHAINESVSISTWHQSTASLLLGELLVCHGNGALVWNGKHAHPPTQYAQRVNRVEGLRAAIYLCNRKRSPLGWTDRASRERNPINLVLEHCRLAVIRRLVMPRTYSHCKLTKLPCCSGLTQMCPSLHLLSSRSSCTLGCECCTSSLTGRPVGSYMRTSQPSRKRMRLASYARRRE